MVKLSGFTVSNIAKSVSFLVFMILAFAPLRISAEEELNVVTEEWSPYNYTENNEVKGLSTEIVRKVLERAGIKYTINVFPWARAYKMAQEKPNCLIYTIIKIDPREKLFKWVRPLGKGGTTSLYRLKENEQVDPKTIEDAKNYKILANRDSMDDVWLRYSGFTKLETPTDVSTAIKMFFTKRADMIAFDDAVLKDEFKKAGFDDTGIVKVMPLFNTPPYMALSLSTSDGIVEKLRKSYDELLKENKIKPVN